MGGSAEVWALGDPRKKALVLRKACNPTGDSPARELVDLAFLLGREVGGKASWIFPETRALSRLQPSKFPLCVCGVIPCFAKLIP